MLILAFKQGRSLNFGLQTSLEFLLSRIGSWAQGCQLLTEGVGVKMGDRRTRSILGLLGLSCVAALLCLAVSRSSLWSVGGGVNREVLISVPEAAEAGLDERNPNAWGYGDGIEEHWGKLGWKTCSTGKHQSPISIDGVYWRTFWASAWAKRFLVTASPPFVWDVEEDEAPEDASILPPGADDQGPGSDGEDTAQEVPFNGHALEIPWENSNITARVPGLLGDESDGEFVVESITVHTPSEHKLAGRRFDMEMQILHRGQDGEIMIAAALFSASHSSGKLVSKVADAIRRMELKQGVDKDGKIPEKISLPALNFLPFAKELLMAVQPPLQQTGNLLHQDRSLHPTDTYSHQGAYTDPDADVANFKNYYSYMGSLSRPPCTEGVKWVVFRHALGVTREDIETISSLQGTGGNARPIQELDGRLVHTTDVTPVGRAV